ncbi:MAG: hypothetical protein H6713_24985 [Myxococcales bacterium]|nr:hypothetical protein [Myxococcales bacterium]MCB9753224.1 hypothetical protein [Myxococcales bacterium]
MAEHKEPPVYPHGALEEVFPDIFVVKGSLRMPGPLPVRFSRNMVVIRQGGALTLVNSMRLDDAGLAALERLGTVAHVVRLAGFHGMDDPFYKRRYDAKIWAVKGMVYAPGFDAMKTPAERGYFHADVYADESTALPLEGAALICFDCKAGEGVLRLDRDGGILVTGDSLQNWDRADRFFNWPATLMMRMMGFIKPYNLGPGWLKAAEPRADELASILTLEFEHVLPAHGVPVIGGAREKYRPAIERFANARA